MGHQLTLKASKFTPVDKDLIPTGELKAVAGTPFDFLNSTSIGSRIDQADEQLKMGGGYDHNWALDKGLTQRPERVALVEDSGSGRTLEVLSTEPGLQMYTGNFIDGAAKGKGACIYRMGDGFVLEPQKFPDTPNWPEFGSARVDPGKPYRHTMVLRMGVMPR